ncbi:ribonuclease HII [Hymenobacter properus]|uniref:Ribonuclease HII n=1 Tax=Hymenobacter properus TaxID=2791026 RepID=A0A931BE41_9BACT|nr:ribonuclease HII [Hymenobacter properus]MBF9142134.1 ribonuclease HII [Hymenobacter properus]MBR7720941.1 ribonuclease HII [Microvirga sp. SRT04]
MLLANYSGFALEAGLDEAGRGCLAGPVFAAAVILPPDFNPRFLNDSKQLSAKRREALRPVICAEAVAWAVGQASEAEISSLNIAQASYLAMHRAVAALSIRPEHLLVDGNRFRPLPGYEHTCIIGGDGLYRNIAAASVLAKTFRDDYMSALAAEFPEYGWAQNAGYPTAQHRQAIRTHGPSPHHRMGFRLL